MSSMLCPVLIGRSAELTALTAALEAAAAGRGSATFVTGDAGVGKSRLLRECAAQASSRGFRVLTGRATESSVPLPYRPVSEALIGAARQGVLPDAPGTAEYRAALGSLVPEWSQHGDNGAEISPVILGEAVLRVLASLPVGGLLILEDLHWADPETLALVEYVADNVSGLNVLCVATLRDSGSSACLDLMQSALARRVAARIEVPRLMPAAVTQMAAACLGAESVPYAVSKLLADCDGLPFAVEEILAAAAASGELVQTDAGWHVDSTVSTGIPDSITGSVRSRLVSLGPAVTNVLVSAAVLGRQFDWALLPDVTGVSEPEVLDALHQAHGVQLIESASAETGIFRFRHSLTRDAILSGLLPLDLASRAAVAAEVVSKAHPGLPGSWCELAAELRAAARQFPDAARLLLTMGRRSLAQGAVGSSTAALLDARRLLADAPAAADLAIEVDEALAEALSLAGDSRQLASLAIDLLHRLEAAGADPRRQAMIRLVTASTRPEDNPVAAAEHLAAAADIADNLQDIELGSRIDAVAARIALAAGELNQAESLAHRALSAAETAGLGGWAAEVALAALEVLGRRERTRNLGAARTAFERARQIAEESRLGAWRLRALHELATLEMLADASAGSLTEVRDLAQHAGALSMVTVIDLQLANLWSLQTDLDRALDAARRCQRSAARIRSPKIEAMALSLQAIVAGVAAGRSETEQVAERAESLLPGDVEIRITTWGQARVLASLFRDDIAAAVRQSDTATSYAREALKTPRPAQGFYSPLQAPLLAPRRALGLHAILAAISGQDGRAAIDLARSTGAAASWNAGCLAYAEAVLEGRAGKASAASALAEVGATYFAPFAPWWNYLMRRLVAPDALQDGWGNPVEWMREAASEFDASGHARLASACRGILRRAGQRVPRAGRGAAEVPPQMRRLGVTSREMDVFLLVALGHSNSEIAATLYISPKTVETHIASLIAKTGQRGRRELVAHAARLIHS
jgi:DNA-binding CsgD family transcriptional regulator